MALHEGIADFIPSSAALTPEGVSNLTVLTPDERLAVGPLLMSNFKSDVFSSQAVRPVFVMDQSLEQVSSENVVLQGHEDNIQHEIFFHRKRNRAGIQEKLKVLTRKVLAEIERPVGYFKVAAITAQYAPDGLTPVSYEFESHIRSHKNTVHSMSAIQKLGKRLRAT